GKRKLYYAISTVIIVLGVVFFFKNGGLNLGVDFKGGRTYQVQFDKDVNTENIKKALSPLFDGSPEVKTIGGSANKVKITTTYRVSDPDPKADSLVEAKLLQGLSEYKATDANIVS